MRAVPTGSALLSVLVTFQSAIAAGLWDRPGGGIVFALATDPSKPATVYGGTARGGIFESTNAGKNWRRVTRVRRPGRIRALAVDGGGRIYVSDADGRLLESTDAGESWSVADSGGGKAEVLSLAVDPRTRPETVYGGTSAGEVRRSADGGRSWSGSSAGLQAEPVLALAVDRRRRPGVVWAGTMGGVFRSIDAGASWSKVNSLAVRELVVDPTRRRTLFAARGGMFRSTDGGRTWKGMAPIRYALSLAIDSSQRPGTVYVGTSYDSVLRSTDGGDTWSAAGAGLSHLAEVIELAVDTRTKPTTLYAATSGLGVYRSTDGGASWLADEGRDDGAPGVGATPDRAR
jgi:photosystem II stability/assembly factor-like uncharacterized protein